MDFSSMSDAELERIAGGGGASQPAAPDFSSMSDAELERIAGGGGGASQPAAPSEGSTFGTLADTYKRVEGLGARAAITGGLTGMAAPATLGVDAAVNAAYGVHKLAAKTGLVSEPNPKSYYGNSDSYLPTTTGFSAGVGELEDKAGLPKPESTAERVLSAVGENAAGGISGAAGGLVAGANKVGRFLSAQPVVQAVAGGAAGGVSQGATEAGLDPTAATVLGMVAGGAVGAAGARAGRPAAPVVPTTEELRAAKTAAYDAKDAAGITIPGQDARALGANMRRDLPAEGVFPEHDSHAAAVLAGVDRLGAPNAAGVRQPVTLAEIEKVRQNATLLQKSPEPSIRRTGNALTGQMDDFIDAIPGAGPLSDTARAANRQYAKASALDLALDKANLRASSTGTGANAENATRQNLRQIIQDPNSRAYRQFSPAERDAMRSIVEGSALQNALRWGGKFAPTGAVSGLFGIGAAASGYGAIPLAGLASKGAADYLHGRSVRNLDRLVKGGPGALQRPSARYGANASRGALRGFLAGPSSYQDDPGANARYR